MNTFTFELNEMWFGGIKLKRYDVKAAHAKSAEKKLNQICGNRIWENVKLVDSTKGTAGEFNIGGYARLTYDRAVERAN